MARMTDHDYHIAAIKAADEAHRLFDVLQARARMTPKSPEQTKQQQADAAIHMQKTYGTKYAATFLRSRGWSFESAMNVLQYHPRKK